MMYKTADSRFTRSICGAIIAAGIALGGAPVGHAETGPSTGADTQVSQSEPKATVRSVTKPDTRSPINSAPGLTNAALGKARSLQDPDHPLLQHGVSSAALD